MNRTIFTFLGFAIALWCASASGQSANCSYITYSLVSDNLKIAPGCDTHFNQQVTETQTYNVTCVNTNTSSTYFTANPQPQITSTGQTSQFCGGPTPINCSPVFEPQNVNAASYPGNNQFFLRVWDQVTSGSQCTRTGFQQNFQQCAAIQCTSGGGAPGSGCASVPPAGASLSSGPSSPFVTECDPGTSPIIIDTEGEGFHLTSAQQGVVFDIRGDGHPLHIAWTDANYHNGFLALDRNGNGLIDNGTELFGNFTSQPKSSNPNGFLALAEFDKPENGGNGDGVIDERDTIYQRLMLWIDENHDGISQPNELHRLSEFGIYSISLSYFESRRQDDFGNQFRYKVRINPGAQRDPRDETPSSDPGRWAYDVFLMTK